MNEAFIKRAVELKLNAAEKVLGCLPPEASEPLRKFGAIVAECLGAHAKSGTGTPPSTDGSGKINSVHID